MLLSLMLKFIDLVSANLWSFEIKKQIYFS